jgi:hypothetical protein
VRGRATACPSTPPRASRSKLITCPFPDPAVLARGLCHRPSRP